MLGTVLGPHIWPYSTFWQKSRGGVWPPEVHEVTTGSLFILIKAMS